MLVGELLQHVSRNAGKSELFFEHAVKSYSSRNVNFDKYSYIEMFEDDYNTGEFKKGIKSNQNKLEYDYRFSHDKNKIYFILKYIKNENKPNISTVLILFDIDRNCPRKMIKFYNEGEKYKAKTIVDDLRIFD